MENQPPTQPLADSAAMSLAPCAHPDFDLFDWHASLAALFQYASMIIREPLSGRHNQKIGAQFTKKSKCVFTGIVHGDTVNMQAIGGRVRINNGYRSGIHRSASLQHKDGERSSSIGAQYGRPPRAYRHGQSLPKEPHRQPKACSKGEHQKSVEQNDTSRVVAYTQEPKRKDRGGGPCN